MKWNKTNNAEITFSDAFEKYNLGEVLQEVKYRQWLQNIAKI